MKDAALRRARRFSVAPMMDWTTRDYRYFARLATRHALLYTEMVTAQAVRHGDREALLGFSEFEHPVAQQLGGNEPEVLAEAAKICEDMGYDEVNLNVGCPSDRVQSGAFGACLMAQPELVAECVAAMQQAVSIPVTVKSRIGIDNQDDYEFLYRFIDTVRQTGCDSFTIHARKAILKGLSPKENREIPPLLYARAYAIKQDFPDLEIILNGGIKTFDEIALHLQQVDGVMLGREAYQNPWILRDVDEKIFGEAASTLTPHQWLENFLPYVEARYRAGHHPKYALKHLLNIFQAVPGARRFRRYLSENMHHVEATPQVLLEAMALVPDTPWQEAKTS